MKKTAFVACAAFLLLFTVSVNAQTDTTAKQPVTTETPLTPETPVTPVTPATPETNLTPETPVTAQSVSTDKWNNWDKSKYAMLPMPEPLTTEKIFPVIGTYQLTGKDGATTQAVINLDPSNKGIVWIEGLPQGKIKAILRKSPATYKIPEQQLGTEDMDATATAADVTATSDKSAKKETVKTTTTTLPEGVLVYDKDANQMNLCIGCKYNAEDPAMAFLPADQQTEPAAEQTEVTTKAKSKKTKVKTKTVKAEPIQYSGNKLIQETSVQTVPAD